MEVIVAIFTMYSMIIPDILLISWCWAIIAQQEVLTQAFKYFDHEDNSQTGNIILNIVKCLLRRRVPIMNNLISKI